MSNYNSLKTTIDANIKQNGRQEITGQILNSVLNQMVTTLGTGYQFAGVATIDTNPGTPDAKVFYIANGKGTYTNFGGINVTEDEVVVLYWDSSWHKVSTGIASQAKLTELEEKVGEYSPNLELFSGYIDNNGTIVSPYGGYYFSNAVKVNKGDIVKLFCNSSGQSVIALYANDSATSGVSLATNVHNADDPYVVSIPSDGYVRVSMKGNDYKCTIIHSNSNESRIKTLEYAQPIIKFRNIGVDNTNGLEYISNTFLTSDFISINSIISFDIHSQGWSRYVFSYDENLIFLGSSVELYQYANAKYIRIGLRYVEGGEYVNISPNDLSNTDLYIKVAKVKNEILLHVGTNHPIKTLKQAFDLLGDGTEDMPHTIILDAETYNAFDGFDISSLATDFVGLFVPKYTTIKGKGIGNTIVKGELASGLSNIDYNNISTLNMEYVNGLEDMTITTYNTRYCVHADALSNDASTKCYLVNKNVHFYHKGLDDGINATAMAYGLGMKSASFSSFENCIFHNNYDGKTTFNLHNRADTKYSSKVIFNGCTFLNDGYSDRGSIGIGNYDSSKSDVVEFNGCSIGAGIWMVNMTNNDNCGISVYGAGNDYPFIYASDLHDNLFKSAYKKMHINGFRQMRALSDMSSGNCVYYRMYNRAEVTSNAKIMYGIVVGEYSRGTMCNVLVSGMIQSSLIGIDGNDGDSVSIENGKLVVSQSNVIGHIVGDGRFVQLNL